MTRPIQYACSPAERYCECGRCQLPPAPCIDLGGVVQLQRATFTFSTFLILLAGLLAFYAIGFAKTEGVHRTIIAERTV
ncbi:hypothetical protein [Ensifer sp. LBL]|uniref:hypothetical protein n=1 Tax=Ensifer sp. LBL TaxID=2991056 RepID=UPI003D24BF16